MSEDLRRFVLLYKAPFWKEGEEIQFRHVQESSIMHVGWLMDNGWRILGIDSDIYGPFRITPKFNADLGGYTKDEGGD